MRIWEVLYKMRGQLLALSARLPHLGALKIFPRATASKCRKIKIKRSSRHFSIKSETSMKIK